MNENSGKKEATFRVCLTQMEWKLGKKKKLGRRMRGRRWWTRYGSFLFLTTVIVFLVKRTPPSPATDAAADVDADAAAADVDVDDWKSEDFVYQRHLLRPPPAHLRQATNDSAATVHVLLTLILITLDNAV